MDLKLFFDPIEMDVDQLLNSFQSFIFINRYKMPNHEGMDIALIGLCEYRGAGTSATNNNSINEVRKELYKLKKGFGNYRIIDLGNLRNGPTLEETYLRIKEVCRYLMEKDIIPVLFGGTHDLDLGQYYGYESLKKLISVLVIDNQMDFDESQVQTKGHLSKIFKYRPNYLFSYYHLAYQSYLTDQNSIELLEKLSFEAIRLGVVKENIKNIEPMIRDTDMMSFDLSALQNLYVPAASDSKIYGLTGEEACQLSWYAGQNEKMSSVGFYNYDASQDSEKRQTAFVLSTMIWYFIEGYYHRKGDKNFKSNDYLMYEVHLGRTPETIRFYQSKLSQRWWMEILNLGSKTGFNRPRMIACNYSDYETALKGEVPDRWINFTAKFKD